MLKIVLTSASLLLAHSSLIAQESTPIPGDVKGHMESMTGSWTFKGTDGGRKFSGEETIRLASHGSALIQEGYFDLGGGKKEHYVILSGWDGTQKKVLVRGFTSYGFSWSGDWSKLTDGKWDGTASGRPASFEVKRDSMRYEDINEGKKWVSEFTRKPRVQ